MSIDTHTQHNRASRVTTSSSARAPTPHTAPPLRSTPPSAARRDRAASPMWRRARPSLSAPPSSMSRASGRPSPSGNTTRCHVRSSIHRRGHRPAWRCDAHPLSLTHTYTYTAGFLVIIGSPLIEIAGIEYFQVRPISFVAPPYMHDQRCRSWTCSLRAGWVDLT